MSTALIAVMSALFHSLVRVAAKLAGEKFLDVVVTDSVLYLLKKLAPLTTNTLDDQIVAEIEQKLKTPQDGGGNV